MAEYTTPEFLKNQSVDEIHDAMLKELPDDIDKSFGQYPWDLTRPTAIEKSKFAQFQLNETLQLLFPQFAYGNWMDLHAENRGIIRKSPTYAIGVIEVSGKEGTAIPKGTKFSTASVNGGAAIEFSTTMDATIPRKGTISISIQATEAGTVGNVTKNTIILKSNQITGITGVNNEYPTSGGTEEEDDDSLRDRVSEYDKTQGQSFVGNPNDYKRWAESIDGTGRAVIIPAQDDTGLVTIILIDSNGDPATTELCKEVYNYIMATGPEDLKRLAPVNAYLKVIPPNTIPIHIKAIIELENSTIEAVQQAFFVSIKNYFKDAIQEGEIRYTRVGSILSETVGVHDYENLLINSDTLNIPILKTELPQITIEMIDFTEGNVT